MLENSVAASTPSGFRVHVNHAGGASMRSIIDVSENRAYLLGRPWLVPLEGHVPHHPLEVVETGEQPHSLGRARRPHNLFLCVRLVTR